MTLRRRRVVAALLLLAPLAVVLHRNVGWAQWSGDVSPLGVDLAAPDAVVVTRSLSALPRELVQVPVVRDLLTEDFVFYYEQHPDRLGLQGSLRRIAWEHQLTWKDELLAFVLDQPAEVALWRSDAGSLDHWLVAVSGRELAGVMREVGTSALKDAHLRVAAQLALGDGATTDLYALEYGSRRTLLFAGVGDRIVAASEPGLILGEDRTVLPEAQALLAGLLEADPGKRGGLRASMHLPAGAADHSIAVRADWLAFRYGRFFPALDAVRFDFGGGRWSTLLRTKGNVEPDPALWAAVPSGAAFCSQVPVDWDEGKALAGEAPAEIAPALRQVAAQLTGPAAICWYGEGRLQAPLVVGTVKGVAPAAPLGRIFNWAIVRRDEGPAVVRTAAGARVWDHEVADVPFADTDSEGRPTYGAMTVTLAAAGQHLYFSPGAARVQEALETAARRFPSIADTLPPGSRTLAVIDPKALAAIGRREALVMLPRADEPVFRTAAERHLLPRFDALAQNPAYRLVLGRAPGPDGWSAVTWEVASK